MITIKKISSKIQHKWNYAINDLRNVLGMNENFFQNARGARILVYHGICQKDHTRFNSIFLNLKIFEAHLRFYKKYFNVISLDDYYNQRFSKDYFNVCLTFDDGFANNYKYVFPLMNKYKVPVTFFITSIRDAGYDILWNDLLVLAQKYGPQKLRLFHQDFYKDKHGRYVSTENGRSLKDLLQAVNFDKKEEMINFFQQRIPADIKTKEEDFWLQMTEHEIRSLSASVLATIGSHGYYHNDLSQIPVNKVKDEMICSKKYLESITGKKINAIAFPYGNYTRDVVAAAKSAGFYQLLATDFRCPEDYSDIEMYERLTVNPYISLNNQITAIIRGKYE